MAYSWVPWTGTHKAFDLLLVFTQTTDIEVNRRWTEWNLRLECKSGCDFIGEMILASTRPRTKHEHNSACIRSRPGSFLKLKNISNQTKWRYHFNNSNLIRLTDNCAVEKRTKWWWDRLQIDWESLQKLQITNIDNMGWKENNGSEGPDDRVKCGEVKGVCKCLRVEVRACEGSTDEWVSARAVFQRELTLMSE